MPVYPLLSMLSVLVTMFGGTLFAASQGMPWHSAGFIAFALLGLFMFYVLDWLYLHMGDAQISILAAGTAVLAVASFALDLMLPTIVIVALALFFLNVAGVRRGFRKDPS